MNIIKPKNISGTQYKKVLIIDSSKIQSGYIDLLSDESKLAFEPVNSIAFPKNLEQLSSVLKHNYKNNTQTTISGARTGVVGGAVPKNGECLLCLDKCEKKEPIFSSRNKENFLLVRANTSLFEISDFLSSNYPAFYLPVNPTETSASIGGAVSTNAAGSRSYLYGSIRDWVSKIKVILSDGSILNLERGKVKANNGEFLLETDGRSKSLKLTPIPKPKTKNSVGYYYDNEVDLIDLFIGSEGTLGLVTEVELKLIEKPKSVLYFLQFFTEVNQVFKFVNKIRDSLTLKTIAIEFFDEFSLNLIRESSIKHTSRAARLLDEQTSFAVYLEIDNETDALNELQEILSSINCDFSKSITGADAKDEEDLRVFRHAVPETINSIITKRKNNFPELHKIATDISVPDQSLEHMYFFYQSELDKRSLEYAIFGHIGDNHFHVNILSQNEQELEKAKDLYKVFSKEAVRLGGAISAEHGIGKIKKELLRIQYSEEEIEKMKKIKEFFDPKMLLNPGVLF